MPEPPKKVVPEDKIHVTLPKMRETPATKGTFQQRQMDEYLPSRLKNCML